MGALRVVVGGQYGSESKGAVTGWLTQQAWNDGNGRDQVIVRVAGPNAGHTAYDHAGRRWALRQVPVGAVTNPGSLVIAAGSEIDPPVLLDEITRLEEAGITVRERLFIDGRATVITDEHKAIESTRYAVGVGQDPQNLVDRIGSTGKGIGAARADRLMRRADTWLDWWKANPDSREGYGTGPIPTAELLASFAAAGCDVTIEGTQGYALGLHAGYYPQCTSSDCRAVDFLAMAGVTPWNQGFDSFQIWLVARAYPIRVAGSSGPLEGETTWAELGLPEEYTTVTQKVRRVGAWDENLLLDAIHANGGAPWVSVAFAMADQMFPGLAGLNGADPKQGFRDLLAGGATQERILRARRALYDVGAFTKRITELTGCGVPYIGTGPNTRIWLPEVFA